MDWEQVRQTRSEPTEAHIIEIGEHRFWVSVSTDETHTTVFRFTGTPQEEILRGDTTEWREVADEMAGIVEKNVNP